MRGRLSDYQEQYDGELFNLEATPAESTVYRFAKYDAKNFPGIITAGKEGETPYYTNSSHLPVSYTEDIFSALDIQDELQTLYTSGTVFHTFLGEKLPDWQSAATLVRKIAENYKLPYYTISPTYSVCRTHGYLAGEQHTCRIAEAKPRFTAESPVTTARCRIGTTAKFRSLRTGRCTACWTTASISSAKPKPLGNAENFEVFGAHPPMCAAAYTLFTTKTCPNCKAAKAILDRAGIKYDVVDAEDEPELALRYGVMQVPHWLLSVSAKTAPATPKSCPASDYQRLCAQHGL